MKYQDRIVRDPQIVGGEPVLKGTRVTLKTALASLGEGAPTVDVIVSRRRSTDQSWLSVNQRMTTSGSGG